MKSFLYILFIFLIGTSLSWSQQSKELKIETQKIVKDSINPLAPAKAAFYSAILPGLGQAYNKKYWKIPIVYAALGAGVYFIIDNNNKYNDYRDEYKARLQGTNNPNDPTFGRLSTESVIRGQKFYQRNRDLSILITGGLYILNIIDANIDAHLLQFNVSDNLTLKPKIQQNFLTNKQDVGLVLSYNF
ncbi:DUF5683 domain-containing protein [Flavobacterium sp.]|uniref:DUF5683 domain-containing protein n=1 Tax=Flavobacterium sp. TaxID=239 RepID=UPI0025BC1A7F|nr:DUF5683 domain-containing protein [Flavobacterium sp.]